LRNDASHNVYFSLHIRAIRSRGIRWVGYVACMRKVRNICNNLVGKPEVNGLIVRPRHRGKIILAWFLKKYDRSLCVESV
jgi:hypothetical protein